MSAQPSPLVLRARILGLLLRDARLAAGRSQIDVAAFLGILSEQVEAYESGQSAPSLPEVEAWAYYTCVPLDRFWSDEVISAEMPDAPNVIRLRQRLVALQMRQALAETNHSLAECAHALGISQEQMEAYESGLVPIPLPELEVLAELLGKSIKEFSAGEDHSSRIHRWLYSQAAVEQFAHMPIEMQHFVLDPGNTPYIEIAMRLSQIPAEYLRRIAESFLALAG